MRGRCSGIVVTLACVISVCCLGGPAGAAIDADRAREIAAGSADALGLPWGEEVVVELKDPEFRSGERITVSYLGFSEVTLDARDGSIINAHNWAALDEFGARPTTVNVSEEEALARATRVAEAVGLLAEPAALKKVWLAEKSENTRRWYVQWVRTANGIPYHSDLASVSLDPSNGAVISCGKTFRSAPPESTEVKVAQEAAVAAAREHARALGFREVADMPPTAELKVVQPNNYWGPGERTRLGYMAPSRVAWEVAIRVPYGPAGGYTDKVLWIDAADGELLGGYGYRGPTSPPAVPKPAEPAATGAVEQSLLIPVTAGGAVILVLICGLLVRARRAVAR